MRSARSTTKQRSTALPARPTTRHPIHPSKVPAETSAVEAHTQATLPYSAYPEITFSASHVHDLAIARRRHPQGGRLAQLYRRLTRRLGLHSGPYSAHHDAQDGALRPGDVLRDFPYFTQASEISFFSTHPSLCDDIFTVGHGDRLRFESGLWAGQVATVIGARAGQLWIVLDGESIARQLPAPENHTQLALSSSDASVACAERRGFWPRVEAFYRIKRLSHAADASSMTPTPTPLASGPGKRASTAVMNHYNNSDNSAVAEADAGASTNSAVRPLEPGLSARILARVDDAVRRVYSAEQRAFLQRAPDLFITIVPEQDHARMGTRADGIAHSLSPFLTYQLESGAESSQSPFYSTPRRHGSGGSEGGGSPFSETSPGSGVTWEDMPSVALRAPLPLVVPGAEHAPSLYTMVAQGDDAVEGKVVLLAPRILAVSGTAGWAGEGTILTDAGGIEHFKASLSASLVCS